MSDCFSEDVEDVLFCRSRVGVELAAFICFPIQYIFPFAKQLSFQADELRTPCCSHIVTFLHTSSMNTTCLYGQVVIDSLN